AAALTQIESLTPWRRSASRVRCRSRSDAAPSNRLFGQEALVRADAPLDERFGGFIEHAMPIFGSSPTSTSKPHHVHVRFAPKADMRWLTSICLLRANSVLTRRSKSSAIRSPRRRLRAAYPAR